MQSLHTQALSKIIASLEAFQVEHGDDAMGAGLIMEAKNKLLSALSANEYEDAEIAREARADRDTRRAESGHAQ